MKKIHVFVLLALDALLFSTCKKDPEVNIQDFTITKENMTVGTTTVSILGAHDWPGKIDCIRAMVSENEYHFNMEEYPAELSANNFSIVMEGLKPGTTYYYFYSVDYGAKSDFETEMKSFTTNDYSLPNVITATVSYVGPDYAVCGGEVADDGGSEVTQRGVCWAQQPNPTIQDNHTVDSCGTGTFTSELKNLTLNTKYYVRAYATNEKGTAYGNDMEFTTSVQVPAVVTREVIDITETSVRVKCEVIHDGGSAVTERGVCWSKDHEPTLDDEYLANGEGLGMFICSLNNLDSDATYQVRAYAKNASGIGFGEVLTFSNAQVQKPTVSTVEVTDVTATSAVCTGNVISDGGAEVTERGACWSTSQNPTISSSHLASGSGMGNFTVNMSGLTPNKTYYVRTYAKNSEGISYGSELNFTTKHIYLPTVYTSQVTDISCFKATSGGNVTNDGNDIVTARGICWSTTENPTISDCHTTDGTGIGNFISSMTDLVANTTYYVKSYATNSVGTSYGDQISFTTQNNTLTFTANGVTFDMVEVEGGTFWMGAQSTNSNGQNYYDEAEDNEQPVHQVTLSGYYIGKFEVTQELWQAVMGSKPSHFTGDTQRPVGYVRWNTCQAFITALNELCAGQLNGKQFSLPTEAQWEFAARGGNQSHGYRFSGSNNLDNVAWYSSNSGNTTHAVGTKTPNELGLYDMSGNVYEWCQDWYGDYDGNAQINPEGPLSGSDRLYRGGSCSGLFKGPNNLRNASYCRVFCRHNFPPEETYWDVGFRLALVTVESPNPSLPVVTTGQVSNITQVSAVSGGTVTSDGGYIVTERGICWSTSHNPTTSGNHAISGTGTGSFTANMTGLTPGTTYYVRAYAINSQGTAYGSEMSFTTQSGGGSGTLTFTANGVTFEMIEVEGGTFWMGAQSTSSSGQNYDSEAGSNEKPVHQVTLSSYHIGKFEVTQQLWQAVMGSNPSQFTGDTQRPVETVSWDDCQNYITALNELCASQLNGKHFSLPTEAQWEYAARGGKQSHGYKYSGSNTLGNVAWYCDNSGSTTHAVGTKTPNELGLYDMSGNVFEWCSDWYGSYGSGAQTDPADPASGSGRVDRGGSWDYYARSCRVSSRSYFDPDDTNTYLGLRLALY